MIKRILDPEEFKILINDVFDLVGVEDIDPEVGHYFLRHNRKSIINNFSNKYILAWDAFVWGNFNGEKYDAMIFFINEKSVKFNESIFVEFLWMSSNPKVGLKLFKEAIKFAREKGFKYIAASRLCRHPTSDKLKNFYEKIGLIKDSETFIAKL